jgi:predicted nucleic acid-binding protein
MLLDSAYEIANQTRQSIYDCLYVSLARLLNGQMVTADRRIYDGLADGLFAEHGVWVQDIA